MRFTPVLHVYSSSSKEQQPQYVMARIIVLVSLPMTVGVSVDIA